MEPNTPPAPPPMQPQQSPQPNDPYQFIVNPNQGRKSSGIFNSEYTKNQKRIFIAVGVVVVIMLVSFISNLLGASERANKQQVITVVGQQRELIRISEIGVKKATTSEARNLAITTQLSLISEQKELEAAAKKLKIKLNAKTIGGKNPKTDELLLKAEQANNFDAVFIDKLQTDLLKYAKEVQTAYKKNAATSAKKELEAQFNNAATLANFKE